MYINFLDRSSFVLEPRISVAHIKGHKRNKEIMHMSFQVKFCCFDSGIQRAGELFVLKLLGFENFVRLCWNLLNISSFEEDGSIIL